MAIPLFTLARAKTALEPEDLRHAQRLVASWQTLADLCFADLLLHAPVESVGTGSPPRFVVLAHVRPTTGQTLYPADPVGMLTDGNERPLVARALADGALTTGDGLALGSHEPIRMLCIPVRHGRRLVGVVTRESATSSGRRHGDLERFYLEVFDGFARMIAEGSFPFEGDDIEAEETPRVGDGVIVLDRDRRVRFASPNAVSAFHRMGIHGYADGLRLGELGFDQDVVDLAFDRRVPAADEVERRTTVLLLQAIPLLRRGVPEGAVLILRDVTDVRHRDRMLRSKDATIREIHHRVKNNLQTIAALLRLQARRSTSPEARAAIAESEQRIRSIAIVHETLSRDAGDLVPFDDIVRPLVRSVEDAVSSAERHVRIRVEGRAGELPGELATPLAVVLNELVQNAVDHAFVPGDGRDGNVVVRVAHDHDEVVVEVADDGVGLPPGFTLDASKGLGLSIVHTLVNGELGGSLELLGGPAGTRATVRVPVTTTPEPEP